MLPFVQQFGGEERYRAGNVVFRAGYVLESHTSIPVIAITSPSYVLKA